MQEQYPNYKHIILVITIENDTLYYPTNADLTLEKFTIKDFSNDFKKSFLFKNKKDVEHIKKEIQKIIPYNISRRLKKLYVDEKELHRKFNVFRCSGEWFKITDTLLNDVNTIIKNGNILQLYNYIS